MNILLLVNELRYTCGVTNHIIHLSRGLTASGKVNLWIITGGGNGTRRFNDIHVKIHSNEKFLHANKNFFTYVSAVTFLNRFIRENKIDLVHSHAHYAANIASDSGGITKVKTVQTNHGILQHKGRLKHFKADKYIAVNEHIYDYILTNKTSDSENVELIRCGIPVDESPAVKESSPIKIIAASRFEKEKGLDTYIKAVSKLGNNTKSKAEFYLAGEGGLEADLKELNESTNAGINFLGSVKDMYELLRKTHILVYPSRSKSEGFPAIITEAGAANNLVISSDFDGVKHVLTGNTDGLIFRQNDEDDLKVKLEDAANNFDKYKEHALKFYNKTKEWFNIGIMINKHIELYEKCLSR